MHLSNTEWYRAAIAFSLHEEVSPGFVITANEIAETGEDFAAAVEISGHLQCLLDNQMFYDAIRALDE